MPGMNSGLSPANPALVAAFRSALLHQGAIALVLIAFLWLLWATARAWRLTTPGTKPEAGNRTAGPAVRGRGRGFRGGAGPAAAAPPEAAGRAAADRVRAALDPGRAAAGAAEDGGRAGLAGHRADRGGVADLGPASGQLGRDYLVLPSRHGRRGVGVDPGRYRRLARRRGARAVVQARRAGQRGLGARGVGVRGVVRRDLRARPELADRSTGGRAAVRGRRGAHRAAGRRLAEPAARAAAAGRHRAVLHRHGGAAGLARSRLLAGHHRGQAGHPGRHGSTMSTTPQPRVLSSLLSSFGSFAASNGFAVNLVVVIVLAAMGAIFLTGRPRLVRYAVWFGIVFCLADWVLVQDLGFLGGLGTDPNSMIPLILLFSAGYLALTPAPREAPATEAAPVAGSVQTRRMEGSTPSRRLAGGVSGSGRWRRQALGGMLATASARSVAAVAALAVILLGAAPMAAAAANRTADPILAQAIAGNSTALDVPAPDFQLTDQNGQAVSLASLRGKVVLMTFLDPVCTTDCPIIAQEFKQAGVAARVGGLQGRAGRHRGQSDLPGRDVHPGVRPAGGAQHRTELAVPDRIAEPARPGLGGSTGSAVEDLPAGSMAEHNDLAVVIDRSGHIREELSTDPGPGTASTKSSFSVLLAQYARQALASP